MTQKISPDELVRLRNNLPIREVLYALRIPWQQNDELCRFRCPKCCGVHTSIHPSQNLGRCFDCGVNFNPIDLVCVTKNVGFRSAVSWLRVLDRLRQSDDYGHVLAAMGRQSRMD